MPRKAKKNTKKFFPAYSGDSYKSLLYGVVTVIVLFILGFSITRLVLHRPQPAIDDHAVSTSTLEEALKDQAQSSKNAYKVQPGDTLWSIAEEKLGSGFEWYKIASLNNIKDPTDLESGTDLKLPASAVVGSDISQTQMQPRKIMGSTYTVVRGDDLWNIAVRAYGDGYRWVDIARINNLVNPDLIHKDNTLKIPRP